MLGATLLLAASVAPDVPPSRPHSHLHTRGEIDEMHDPLLFQVTYTGEVVGNVSGGLKRGARYLDNLDLVFEADMDALVGWDGAQLHVYGLYNNGSSISSIVGDAQGVSNIETGKRAIRLYQAWIDQKIGDIGSVRAGLYDLNSEFDSIDAAGLFVGSAHGIGSDYAQSGENGPSIFPSTSLAVRAEITPSPGWAVRAAILDAVPGDPNRPGKTVIRLGNGEGALLTAEVEAPISGGKLALGHWRYTAPFAPIRGGAEAKGNNGSYVRAEMQVAETQGARVDAFVRLGIADGQFNMFKTYFGTGLKFTGWLDGRSDDEFGVALAAAFTSSDYRRETDAGSSEIALEATYRAPIAANAVVQPNVQYIRRPSADRGISHALVLGLRTEISFTL